MSVYLSVQRFGVSGVEVRKPEHLIGVNSLIIPDSESTTRAAAARSDEDRLKSEPNGSRSRFRSFLFLKINIWCQLT
jgi:hypothetical protein